jgi:hypothetical protein
LSNRTRHRNHLTVVPLATADADAGGDDNHAAPDGPLVEGIDWAAPTTNVAFSTSRWGCFDKDGTRGEAYFFRSVLVVDQPPLAAPTESGQQAQDENTLSRTRLSSRLRRLSRAAHRPRGFGLEPDEIQLGRFRRLRTATSVARFQDGFGRRGLADEPVHADPLDARLRQRTLRRLCWGVGSLRRLRLVLGPVKTW